MEGIELIAFQIIAAVGSARSNYVEAIRQAKIGEFEQAEKLIKEGEKFFLEGHKAHSTLIQKEASEGKLEVNLILLHAEDQLMSAETLKIVADELIEVHRELTELKNHQ